MVALVLRAVDLHGTYYQRADGLDVGRDLELTAEAFGEDGGGLREVGGAVAGHPEVGGDLFDEAADLLVPAAVEGEEDADEEDGQRDAADGDREARLLGEEILTGDQ